MNRLFAGLRFYFHPPPNISKLHALKAKLSVKNGATIANSADDEFITQVIVEPGVSKLELTKLRQNVDGNRQFVLNSWPSDCIKSKRLLDIENYTIDSLISEPSPREAIEPLQSDKRQADAVKDSPAKVAKLDSKKPLLSVEKTKEEVVDAVKGKAPSQKSPTSRIVRARREHATRIDVPDQPKLESSPPSGVNPNQRLVDIFEDYVESRKSNGQEFSSFAYERALRTLRRWQEPLTTYEQAIKLPGFGKKTAELVEDILNDRIPQEVLTDMRQKSSVLGLFETVYGVGPRTARQFYDKGYRTLAEIRKNTKDKRMIVSIDHHQEFIERISRHEVEKHYRLVESTMKELDAEVKCYCMGSYRRGQPDCGDIDIIVTKEGASMKQIKEKVSELLQELTRQNFAKFTFGGGEDDTRWLGATAYPGIDRWRRMDILCVPWHEFGAAMIYYTGNDMFNRHIRLTASKKGMRLTQAGLFRIASQSDRKKKDSELELLEGHDEARIFELVGIPWLEPEERIF